MSFFRTRQSPGLLVDAGLRVDREQPGATYEVWLSGRIDIESAPDMGKVLLHRLRLPACRTLTIHSEGVVYIDVAGLATLLEILKAARLLGKQLLLNGLRERPRYLLEVTRLLHLFNAESASTSNISPVPTRP